MLLLSGNDIVEKWPFIRNALKLSALPTADTGEEKLTNIYKSLLEGLASCWVTMNGKGPKTLVITTISEEEISGTKNLLIYCAHGFQKETSKGYVGIVEKIQKYARAQGCDNIIAYVWDDKMKKILERSGAQCNYALVVFPLIEKINIGA